MKLYNVNKIAGFLIAFLIIAFMPTLAQTSSFSDNAKSYFSGNGDGVVESFTGVIDSTADILYSNTFSLGDYDNDSFTTYPPSVTLLLSGGTASTQKVNIILLGSNIPNASKSTLTQFVTLDTISYKDSSTSILYKTFTAKSDKFARYMLLIQGTTGNVLTNFNAAIYMYRRDH